ncbi:MAG: histidinol-phosphate transaminase [Clostridiaceae bacterium]|nr:histidinol-phosphate transaminase [Clostridiaceae bacterium]
MNRFWSDTVRNILPYIPGEQPKDKKYIKLNTNENPYPPSPKVLEAIRQETGSILRLYPDPEASSLKETLSDFYQVRANEVFVGNGSDEILAFCFPAFFNAGDVISFPEITYSFYPVYADLFGLKCETIALNRDFTVDLSKFPENVDGILLANPNAPTGIAVGLSEIEILLQKHNDKLVIIDEAYVDFGAESAVPLIKNYENLLVVQTFSKSRSLAGLRVGFALGNKDLIEALNRVKNSFNSYTVDRIAQRAAVAAVRDKEYFTETLNRIIKTREETAKRLISLGFNVLPSKTNFLFVSHDKISGRELFSRLRHDGILVRHFDGEGIENYLRITIGTDEEMEVLVERLQNFLRNSIP